MFYWIKTGFKTLENTPKSMEDRTGNGQGKPTGLTSFGDNTVIYGHCNDETSKTCDLRSFNVETGHEQISSLPPEIQKYNARLLTFGADKKTAYFIGISNENAAAFQKQAEKITGGKTHFENDPEIDKLYTPETQTIDPDTGSGKSKNHCYSIGRNSLHLLSKVLALTERATSCV